MAQTDPNNEAIKQALKEAFAETLHEQRELLHEVFAEVLEDFALDIYASLRFASRRLGHPVVAA